MRSPWETTEQDPAVARLVQRRAPQVHPEPSLLRQPARLVVVAGAALAVAASPLPWLVRVGNPPPQTVTGWSGLADGFLLAVTAGALVALVLNRDASESRSPVFRWLPLLLAAVAATLGVGAVRSMENQIHIWQREGTTGTYQPAFYVALVGAAIVAIGGAWIGVRRVRDPARPSESLRPSRATVVWALLGGIGAVVGAGGVAIVILNSGLDPVAMSLPLMVGVMIGAIVGGNIGAGIARTLTARPTPTEESGLDRVMPTAVRTRGGSNEQQDRDVR
jgi:hypothetical protein